MSRIKAPVPHLPFNLRWICIGCLYSPDTVLWSLRAMAISHEDLPLVISVGLQRLLPFIRYTGLRTFLCPNVPIRQSALLHTCTKGLICSQENLFIFLHIQTCINMLFFFSRLFITHAAQVLPFTKLLRMVQVEKCHIECMHRFSHTKSNGSACSNHIRL